MRLFAYLATRYLSAFIKVLLVITFMIGTIDFFENFRRMGSTSDPLSNAITISLLGTPSFIAQALPLVLLLASVAFAMGLVRSSEIVVIRANGKSALNAMFAPICCAIVIALVSIFYFEPLAFSLRSKFDSTSADLVSGTKSNIALDEEGYWLRQATESGAQLIHANEAQRNGRVLRDITVYDFDAEGQLKRQFIAEVAILSNSEWVFIDAIEWDTNMVNIDPAEARQSRTTIRTPTTITPKQIQAGFPTAQTLNPIQIGEAINNLRASGFSTLSYQVERLNQLTRPIYFASLILIGAIFVFQSVRSRGVGLAILYSVMLGFGLFFVQNFGKSLGTAGEIPAILAALGPSIVAIFLALALYLNYEDG